MSGSESPSQEIIQAHLNGSIDTRENPPNPSELLNNSNPFIDAPDMNNESLGRLAAISLHLPKLWSKAPDAYFTQIEAAFEISNITVSRTKYLHLVKNLPEDVAINVADVLVTCATSNNPYETLKAALLTRHLPTDTQRLENVLNGITMGDRSPSVFYRDMKMTAGSRFTDDLIRSLWARRLPKEIEVPVVAMSDTPIETVLTMADNVWEVTKRNTQISAVNMHDPWKEQMSKQIEVLTQSLSEMRASKGNTNSRSRSRNRSHSRSRAKSHTGSGSQPADSDLCWYHERWGKDARKCKSPCKFQGN